MRVTDAAHAAVSELTLNLSAALKRRLSLSDAIEIAARYALEHQGDVIRREDATKGND